MTIAPKMIHPQGRLRGAGDGPEGADHVGRDGAVDGLRRHADYITVRPRFEKEESGTLPPDSTQGVSHWLHTKAEAQVVCRCL